MFKTSLAILGLLGAVNCLANQTVELKPGATVTLDRLADTTTVSCQAQQTSGPKCLCVLYTNDTSHNSSYALRLYPQDIALERFGYRVDCVRALPTVPECKQ